MRKQNHKREHQIKKYNRVSEELERLNNLPPEKRLDKAHKISLFTNIVNDLEQELFNEGS